MEIMNQAIFIHSNNLRLNKNNTNFQNLIKKFLPFMFKMNYYV